MAEARADTSVISAESRPGTDPQAIAQKIGALRFGDGTAGLLEMGVWFLLAAAAIAVAWQAQIVGRASLVWDEAVRVDAGSALVYAARAGDGPAVWTWLSTQVFYPFVVPGLNGLSLLATGNPTEAAWLPSLIAYGFAGVVAALVAGKLKAPFVGSLLAGLLTWSTPLFARVAAGGFTEPVGACVIGLVVASTISTIEAPNSARAIATGLLTALAWFVKYDYGILALLTVGFSAAAALYFRPPASFRIRHAATAVASAFAPVALWFVVNPQHKLQGAVAFIGQATPGSSGHADFAYYAVALVTSPEVGLGLLTVFVFLAGLVTAIHQTLQRPHVRAYVPLLAIGTWYVMYSVATIKYSRYVAVIVPLLAALAGAALSEAIRLSNLRLGIEMRRLSASVAGALILGQLILQVSAPATGLNVRFWFLQPNPSATAALAFAASHLDAAGGPVLMLGQTNELSPAALHLEWSARLGRLAPAVNSLGEAGHPPSMADLTSAMTRLGDRQVVGVFIGPPSTLNTVEDRDTFPSQPAYLQLASQLEASGGLTLVDSASLERGALRVDVWHLTGL